MNTQPSGSGEDDKAYLKNTETVLEHLAAAMFNATSAKAWLSAQNIGVFLYNVLVSEMMNPFISKGNNIWVHLSMICYNLIEMLQHIKKEGMYSHRQRVEKVSKTPLEARGLVKTADGR